MAQYPTEWVEVSVPCPLCGGTFLHAVGCHHAGKSFVARREFDVTVTSSPEFLRQLEWQREMRIGTQVLPVPA